MNVEENAIRICETQHPLLLFNTHMGPGSHKDFILHIADDKQIKLTAQKVNVCEHNHLHKILLQRNRIKHNCNNTIQ